MAAEPTIPVKHYAKSSAPEPPAPTFEEQVAEAARLGVTVTVLTGHYPPYVSSTRVCPQCGQTIAPMRLRKDQWTLQKALEQIKLSHHPATCEQVRLERTPHRQWGLDYGHGEVQKWGSEQEARGLLLEHISDAARLVYREVGPWTQAPPVSPTT